MPLWDTRKSLWGTFTTILYHILYLKSQFSSYPSSTNPFSLNKEVRDLKKVFQLSHPKSESSGWDKRVDKPTGDSLFFLSADLVNIWASPVAQTVKNLPAMQETWVWSLGWEDPLEKGIAPHSSIFAWRIPWTEELGGLQSMGSQRVRYNQATFTFIFSDNLAYVLCAITAFVFKMSRKHLKHKISNTPTVVLVSNLI